MTTRDGFLSRWSRRKLEVQETREDSPSELPRELPTRSDDPGGGVPATSSETSAETVLLPEEIARLPRIDEFTSETDLAPFLRTGVPDALRRAALRRMWAVDPAIRDYVGDALDYAYDWNTPGGVPGSGPLLPTDDIQAVLSRMFGDSPEGDPPSSEEEGEGTEIALDDSEPQALALIASPASEASGGPTLDGPLSLDLSEAPSVAPASVRRHGRAVPT